MCCCCGNMALEPAGECALLSLPASHPPIHCRRPLPPQVNVESPEMRALGEGMQLYSLPWFHTFIGGALVSSFSANLHTVDKLRAEVAASKACTDPGCSMY